MINRIYKYHFATAMHTPICVIGGGSASLNFTAQLSRRSSVLKHSIRVFEPSKIHYYQPAWTMVGGGISDVKDSYRPQSEVFGKHINFTQNAVQKVIPEQNKLITDDGKEWTYDHLVVTSGIRCDFDGIKGKLNDDRMEGIFSS